MSSASNYIDLGLAAGYHGEMEPTFRLYQVEFAIGGTTAHTGTSEHIFRCDHAREMD